MNGKENEPELDSVITGTVAVPMDQLIIDLIDKVNSDSILSSLFYSALENFKRNIDAPNKNAELLYAFCVGWILNDLMRTTLNGCDSNSKISQMIKEKRDKLVCYKTRLADGRELVISTDDEMVIDNEFISKVEKQTGHKITNPFHKITKEEADKLHNTLLHKLQESSLKTK